ncbi:hypothetical protein VTN96DRAFT_6355 [Rasamsonia emersonii]
MNLIQDVVLAVDRGLLTVDAAMVLSLRVFGSPASPAPLHWVPDRAIPIRSVMSDLVAVLFYLGFSKALDFYCYQNPYLSSSKPEPLRCASPKGCLSTSSFRVSAGVEHSICLHPSIIFVFTAMMCDTAQLPVSLVRATLFPIAVAAQGFVGNLVGVNNC